MDFKMPLYGNTPDNTHCFQAGMKMMMKCFWPQENYSFKRLDSISAKAKGKWTWPMAAMVWFANRDIEVRNIELFDYKQFAKDGEKYLLAFYGDEVGRSQIQHSNIRQEIAYAKEFIKKIKTTKKVPKLDDITDLLDDGFIVCCNVNSRALNRKKGYSGHFVIVKRRTRNHIILNDPGLPARENRRVSIATFERAWAYPEKKAKNIMAFRQR